MSDLLAFSINRFLPKAKDFKPGRVGGENVNRQCYNPNDKFNQSPDDTDYDDLSDNFEGTPPPA